MCILPRVIDDSYRALTWAEQAVFYVLQDPEIKQILKALDQIRPVLLEEAGLDLKPIADLRTLASKAYSEDGLSQIQESAAASGNICFLLERRIEELIFKDFAA